MSMQQTATAPSAISSELAADQEGGGGWMMGDGTKGTVAACKHAKCSRGLSRPQDGARGRSPTNVQLRVYSDHKQACTLRWCRARALCLTQLSAAAALSAAREGLLKSACTLVARRLR
jgi:hypothetical protein